MMSGLPVSIAVVFQPGAKAKPVWFELNRKQHKIARTTYYWQDRVGDTPLLHWAVVTDEDALYEIVFNSDDQSWLLYPHRTE
jgi:DTW domain-containing protein YfiP